MTPRMTNPALLLPEALEAALALSASTAKGDLSQRLTELVMLRASQVNGCGVCVDMHTKGARRDGETEERLHAVAAWRDTAFFSDAEAIAAAVGAHHDAGADHVCVQVVADRDAAFPLDGYRELATTLLTG
jgi:AhpD family alkylhydroperoxidase